MAPADAIAEGASPKNAEKKQDAEEDGTVVYSDALPRMTPELLHSICKERQMWAQPHLNTQMWLNYKGFLRIEGMEDYVNVRALHLDNNNIIRIEGLDRMTELRSLHLGGNRLSKIEGLEANLQLRSLNLETNAIGCIENVRHLTKLETFSISSNRVARLEDLSEIRELPSLTNFEVANNIIEDDDGVVEFWSELTNLKVLRFQGNGCVRHVSHYRKRLINSLPKLSYLDERPVFPVERKSSAAWAVGGVEAMHEAKKEFHRQRHAACGVEPERRELVTMRRKMAIERLDRQEKERAEKEEQERLEADKKKNTCMDPGAGKKAEEGDPEALDVWAESWRRKKSLYGEDGLKTKVAQEMGEGRGSLSTAQADVPAQRAYNADFDFAPPSRGAANEELPTPSPSMSSSAGQGRHQQRPNACAYDFRVRASSEKVDNADLQFSILPEDIEHVSRSSGAEKPGSSTSRAGGAADGQNVMPLIWEKRQAETAAAEAECFDRQGEIMRASRDAGPAAFRSNELEGLD